MTNFNCPLSHAKAEELIDILVLPSPSRVIDVGCGAGELLVRLANRYPISGVGVDIDADIIEQAQHVAAQNSAADSIDFRLGDIKEMQLDDDTFDCGICLAATHAYASGEPAYYETLVNLRRIVRPGGLLLVGEGYWMQPPPREYLDVIGEPVGIYRDHFANVALGEELGLLPLHAAAANADEWDAFEWRHHRRFICLRESQDTPITTDEQRERRRQWCNAYLRWGRSTMGFGFYLFARPRAA